MTTIIRDTTVVTGDIVRTILYDSTIAIRDDRIAAIGPSDEVLSRYYTSDVDVLDGTGKVVFPGLINAHTHLLAVADRGILEDFGFPTTLRFPGSGRSLLSVEERNVIAQLAVLEAIRSGTTCMLEISNNIPDYAESLNSTGARFVLAENINDFDEARARDGVYDFLESKLDAGLERSVELIEKWHDASDGRITCFMAPHAPENCSPALLRRSRDMAEHYNIGYTIHLSQSRKEIAAVMWTHGVLPTHYLFQNELLGPRLVAAHCRYVDSSEIALLGQTRAAVSNNAAIAARRGAAAPIKELQAAGCAIGMGTDNMAEDMVEVMRTGLFIERVRRNDEMYPQPEDVLEWATRGSARAMGMDEQIGALEVGKKADLFVIDAMKAHLVPTLRIVSAFVHQGQPSDITEVMVDGRWLMRDGKVLTIDEAEVVKEAERIGHAAWRRLVEQYPNVPFPISLPPHPLGGQR